MLIESYSYLDCALRDYEYALTPSLSSVDDWSCYLFIAGRASDYYLEHLFERIEQRMPFESLTEEVREMTPKERLFADFFNQAYSSAISSLTLEEIRERIQACEKVALEAKASIRGYSAAESERVSKLSKSEREKLLNTPDITVSDSIAGVKRRADRISAKDKLAKSYADLGLDEETAAFLLGTVKVDETKQSYEVTKGLFKSEAGAFVGPDGKTRSALDKEEAAIKAPAEKKAKLSKMDQAIQDMIAAAASVKEVQVTQPLSIVPVVEKVVVSKEPVVEAVKEIPKKSNPFEDLFK